MFRNWSQESKDFVEKEVSALLEILKKNELSAEKFFEVCNITDPDNKKQLKRMINKDFDNVEYFGILWRCEPSLKEYDLKMTKQRDEELNGKI